jgi:hypothetical protein
MVADVAGGDAAKQRIHQRMDRHIGIAVPGQAVGVIMRSPHSHSSSPGTRRWTSKPDPVRKGIVTAFS